MDFKQKKESTKICICLKHRTSPWLSVSRRPHAAQPRIQTHAGLCEIYDWHSPTGTRFSLCS